MEANLLVANLGCEDTLAGRALRAPARRRAAAFGTLMRCLASDRDALWLPAPLPAERLTPSLPQPRLIHGRRPAARRGVGWCMAEALPGGPGERVDISSHLARALWAAPRPAPDVVAAVNHKAYSLLLGRRWGEALPEAIVITEMDQVLPHLYRLPPGAPWVAKHPLAAAGRARVCGVGQSLPTPLRARIEALLGQAGLLVLEPWLERKLDIGRVGFVDDGGAHAVGAHKQLVSSRGEFLGIALAPLPAPLSAHFKEVAARVGAALHERGYRGPYSVDGFIYADDEGSERAHLLGEINARMTFGLLAHVIAERYVGSALTLRLGDGASLRAAAAVGHVEELLLPRPDDDSALWLELG